MGPDGRSLFFCSYGHDGIGGSDIYMSIRLDDSWLRWSDPVNLGPSINTAEEETYFSITGDFKYLYYSSYKPRDKNRNILEVELPEDFVAINGPVLVQLDSSTISKIMLSGNYEVNQQGRRRNAQGVSFEGWPGHENLLADASDNHSEVEGEEEALEKIVAEEIAVAMQEAAGAEPKQHQAAGEDNFSSAPVAISLSPAAEELYNFLQNALPELDLEVHQKQDTIEFKIVQNLLYNFNSVFVSAEYLPRLSRIARILRQRPELKVQLIGHTDNVGQEEINKKVAEQRVQNLVYYFRDRSIEPARIEVLGAGQANPLASNENEEGRKENRRVETIIRFIE